MSNLYCISDLKKIKQRVTVQEKQKLTHYYSHLANEFIKIVGAEEQAEGSAAKINQIKLIKYQPINKRSQPSQEFVQLIETQRAELLNNDLNFFSANN